MSAQTDEMRTMAAKLETSVLTPWTGDLLPTGAAAAVQLRNAAANQDLLVARLAALGITVALISN